MSYLVRRGVSGPYIVNEVGVGDTVICEMNDQAWAYFTPPATSVDALERWAHIRDRAERDPTPSPTIQSTVPRDPTASEKFITTLLRVAVYLTCFGMGYAVMWAAFRLIGH